MGKVRKVGDFWYADYYANGRRTRKSIGKSKYVAEQWLKKTEGEVARGELGLAPEAVPIGEFFEKYLAHIATHCSTATHKRYRAVVDHFLRYLAKETSLKSLTDIQSKDIDGYSTWRREHLVNPNGQAITDFQGVGPSTRKGAQATTVNFEINTLRAALNVAIKWNQLRRNPTVSATRIKEKTVRNIRILSDKESRQLLAAAEQPFRDIFSVFLNTGMRLGELANLEWSDIDFQHNLIYIRHKANWNPKSGERNIPMNSTVSSTLGRLAPKKHGRHNGGYVFCRTDGKPLTKVLRSALLRTALKAGISDLTSIHAFRHTFASQLLARGVSIFEVQRLLGHSDIKTTMIYAHLLPGKLEGAVEKLVSNKDSM